MINYDIVRYDYTQPASLIATQNDPNPKQHHQLISQVVSWADPEPFNHFYLEEGNRPKVKNEVVVGSDLADRLGLKVGDSVKFQLDQNAPIFQLKISGFLKWTESGYHWHGNDNIVVMTADGVRDITGSFDKSWTEIRLSISEDESVATTKSILGNFFSDYLILDAQDLATIRDSLVDPGNIFMLFIFQSAGLIVAIGFSVFASILAVFTVKNTLVIVLSQRIRETALLRIVGAGRGQIFRMIIIEALFVSFLAAVGGVAFGALIAWLVLSLPVWPFAELAGSDLISSGAEMLPIAWLISLLSILTGAIVPAWRCSRLSIVEVLNQVENIKYKSMIFLGMAGGILVTAGCLIIYLIADNAGQESFFSSDNMLFAVLFLSAGAVFLGSMFLSPILISLLSRLVSLLGHKLKLTSLLIACRNIMRQPRRSAVVSQPILILVALLVSVSVIAGTINATLVNFIAKSDIYDWSVLVNPGDLDDQSPTINKIPKQLVDQFKSNQKFQTVSAERYLSNSVRILTESEADSDQKPGLKWNYSIVGIDSSLVWDGEYDAERTYSIDSLKSGQILVNLQSNSLNEIEVGDSINLEFKGTKATQTYEVGGFFSTGEFYSAYSDFVLDHQFYESNLLEYLRDQYSLVTIKTAEGVTEDVAQDEIDDIISDHPNLIALNIKEEIANDVDSFFKVFMNIVRGLLAVSVLVTTIGIFNTLLLSAIERRREIGVLRAVGLAKRHLYSMINYEAMIMSLYGVLIGISVGLFLGWTTTVAMSRVMVASTAENSSEAFSMIVNISVWELIAYCLLAVAISFLASIIPFLKASRLNIVDSINGD